MQAASKTVEPAEGDVVYPTPDIVQCPFPFYRALRAEQPAIRRTHGGEYLVYRPDDIVHVSRHPEIFSNFIGPVTPGLCQAFGIDPATADDRTAPTPWPTPFTDGKDHDDKRALLMSIVKPEKLAAYEPIIRRVADQLIDAFIDKGRCAFKADFAQKLPPDVTLQVLGVPREDTEKLSFMLNAGAGGQGIRHATPEQHAENAAKQAMAKDYFRGLMQRRLESPQDDFLSNLLKEKMARDGKLDLEFLLTDVIVLYGASFGNTVDMMTQVMYHLIRYPAVMERVREKPQLLVRVIEETLRVEAPVQWVARRVLEDTELSGVKIPKESICLVMYGAANLDDAKFDKAETFDIDRPKLLSHMAFGHGEHRCVGEALARLEGKVSFEQVLARLKNIRMAPGQEHIPNVESTNHRGLVELNVEFERA